MDHFLIVDGSNLLFQMFYGMPTRFVGKHGKPIHGTVGFLGALLKVIRWVNPTHVCVCFDGACENFRRDLDNEYKANRPDFSDVPEDDLPFSQLPDIYAALDHLGICHRETDCCEADDWMASFAKTYGGQGRVTIVSQDSDLFQLVTENVHVLRYRGDNSVLCDPEYIQTKLGVSPKMYADYKSLTGDSSDNIKGVDKVGPKTAATLMQQFGSLEYMLEHLEEISRPGLRNNLEQAADRVRNNKRLIRLDGCQQLPFSESEMRWQYAGQTSTQILTEIGIK